MTKGGTLLPSGWLGLVGLAVICLIRAFLLSAAVGKESEFEFGDMKPKTMSQKRLKSSIESTDRPKQ